MSFALSKLLQNILKAGKCKRISQKEKTCVPIDFKKRERAAFVVIILLFAGWMIYVGIPSYSFEVEGDTYGYQLLSSV